MSWKTGTIQHFKAVTPSDDDDIEITAGIMVNVSGAVKLTLSGGSTGIFQLLAGVMYPLEVKRVWEADTDADLEIKALYW